MHGGKATGAPKGNKHAKSEWELSAGSVDIVLWGSALARYEKSAP